MANVKGDQENRTPLSENSQVPRTLYAQSEPKCLSETPI